jgi:hypothetical protein
MYQIIKLIKLFVVTNFLLQALFESKVLFGKSSAIFYLMYIRADRYVVMQKDI